jgi:hypothetical protein
MARLDTGEGERLAAAIFDYLGVDDEYHDKGVTIETNATDGTWIIWESRAYMTREQFAAFFNDLSLEGTAE